ncbi:MAG: type I glyceraldehyde-3-phosphate dehydrogenase [bacterium]|nr:type I glyceraldehyde-3-phosphate dehydrogenase [bacterium]
MNRIAINGFGRIGRLLFRRLQERSDVEVVAINDLGSVENLAYLLSYDSVYGRFEKEVNIKEEKLVIEGRSIVVLQEKDPEKLPWKELNVDLVVEATGMFESFEKAQAHITAGAKRVVLTAPAKDQDSEMGKTILMGVNDKELSLCKISSNGSCTTNAASPIIQVLSETIGILKALLNTSHGYTASQSLVDGPTRGNDPRRGRAAASNIVPSSTGAAIAVTRALPHLKGKFDGVALRVPVVAGSIADITFVAKRNTTVKEVNDILLNASQEERWKGILKVTSDPIVSSDIIGEPYGAIVDASFTRVVDKDLVKVLSWYDNEMGYVATLEAHIIKALTYI